MDKSNRAALRGPFARLVSKYETDYVFNVSEELRYTRVEAIRVLQCANWIAIRKLEKLLKKWRVRTARQLFMTPPQKFIDADGIGTVTLYVAMCILDAHDFKVAEWWGWDDAEQTRRRRPRAEVEDALRSAAAPA